MLLILPKGRGVHMMVPMEVYLRRGQQQFRQWTAKPPMLTLVRLGAYWTGGFLLSAASLGMGPLPLAMGLCCSATGWHAMAAGLGSAMGYLHFWQEQGLQGVLWSATGSVLGLVFRRQKKTQEAPLLIFAMVCFLNCLTGFLFQVFQLEVIAFGYYVFRVFLSGGAALLFEGHLQQKKPFCRWLCYGALSLAMSQITPLPWLNLGCIFWGLAALNQSLPCAVMVGLGLDLASPTPVSMSAAICLACYLVRQSGLHPAIRCLLPSSIYTAGLLVTSSWDVFPIPGILLGSAMGILLPPLSRRHAPGSTGYAQVQLELTAGILADTQQLLLELPPPVIDEEALLDKVRLRTCIQCPLQRTCREQALLTTHHLNQPLDFACRRPNLIQPELRLGRESLLSLRREKERLREYRRALIQQYQFLSTQLRTVADNLPKHPPAVPSRYRIQVSARSRSKYLSNGDQCMAFPSSRCRCYVLLCDGMGTGLGASQESQSAADLLKKMLTAGFSAKQALYSINSLLILRGQAGAVTMDLAEVELSTGRVILYKWGASPSWLLSHRGISMVGSTTPPPGLSMDTGKPLMLCLSLRQEETLLLVSDGIHANEAALRGKLTADMPPGDLADTVLRLYRGAEEDDATVAAIRLTLRAVSEAGSTLISS